MLRKCVAIFAAVLVPAFAATPAQAVNVERLMAPVSACPNQEGLDAPVATQEQAMRCMTNYARRQAGLTVLSAAPSLDLSAENKSMDIIRCNSFSHEACGRSFTFWMQRAGYMRAKCWRAGENIAWGTEGLGTVRSIFRAWLNSTEHRKNILGNYRQLGIGLEVGTLESYSEAHVWTQHFGAHC
jgi:uncharacterized protein YkwD